MVVARTVGAAVITGANGGMGRACARRLGTTMDLVLTDVSPRLHDFARELEFDGYQVREAIVGDFRSDEVLCGLARHASQGFAALVHAAGLPPSAPWRDVVEVNLVSTVKLLQQVGPHVGAGTVAVLIASVAGHVAPPMPAAKALLAAPLSPTLLDELEPLLRHELGAAADQAIGLLAYALAKRGVIELCEANASDWGARGGRIVSISPGMIFTPMGRAEAELDEAAEAQVKSAPAGRWGTASEIADAASFLLSPAANFITGTDLRVDGGAFGAMRSSDLPPWIDMVRDRMS